VRNAAVRMLVWSLSPFGTIVNAAGLFAVLVIAGVGWNRPVLWVAVAIFLASSAYLDVRAYVARRREGLSAYQTAELVLERIWGIPRASEEDR
jgi:hypothetical protein